MLFYWLHKFSVICFTGNISMCKKHGKLTLCKLKLTWQIDKSSISIFFRNIFFLVFHYFSFFIMCEKIHPPISLVVSEIQMFYLHFKSKIFRKKLEKFLSSTSTVILTISTLRHIDAPKFCLKYLFIRSRINTMNESAKSYNDVYKLQNKNKIGRTTSITLSPGGSQ